MKRENIKFRQAIFEKGKFFRWQYWGYGLTGGFTPEFIGPITISGINNQYEIKESQQFTGLKDINGIDIYEGDKIINQSRNSKNPHPIIFHEGKFVADYGGLYYDFSQEIERERIEVVGNIYE